MTENIYQKNNCASNDCPIRDVLDRFGDKWSMLVLLVLEKFEILRFGELKKQIGDISQKMLTVTLRTMEADGLVTRTIFAEMPPRVEYQITSLGRSLVPYVITYQNGIKKICRQLRSPGKNSRLTTSTVTYKQSV